MNFGCLLTFKKKKKKNQNILSGTLLVSKGLDPDQALRSVGPDLGPNCLQRLSADEKVTISKDRVNSFLPQQCLHCL